MRISNRETWSRYRPFDQLPGHSINQLAHFFLTRKPLYVTAVHVGDLRVQRSQHGDGVDLDTWITDIRYPCFHHGTVLFIYRTFVWCQVDLFTGVVIKREKPGIIFEHEAESLLFIVLHNHIARDRELSGGLQEGHDRDRVTVDIARPVDAKLRADGQF